MLQYDQGVARTDVVALLTQHMGHPPIGAGCHRYLRLHGFKDHEHVAGLDPVARLHGLRMMDPTIFSHIPFTSVDSSGVARNVGMDVKWSKGYASGLSKEARALVLADRMENHAAATRWAGWHQQPNLELLG